VYNLGMKEKMKHIFWGVLILLGVMLFFWLLGEMLTAPSYPYY